MKWQTDIVPGAEISPEEWDDFVQRSPQGSLYVLHGYATAIKPGWQAAIVKNETGWQAVMHGGAGLWPGPIPCCGIYAGHDYWQLVRQAWDWRSRV